MLLGKKIVVVMPAYNAELTLRRTYDEVMAQGVVDEVIVVDDSSHDATVAIARTLPHTRVAVHPQNRGYGGNQKTCYALARAAELLDRRGVHVPLARLDRKTALMKE